MGEPWVAVTSGVWCATQNLKRLHVFDDCDRHLPVNICHVKVVVGSNLVLATPILDHADECIHLISGVCCIPYPELSEQRKQ